MVAEENVMTNKNKPCPVSCGSPGITLLGSIFALTIILGIFLKLKVSDSRREPSVLALRQLCAG